MTIDKTIASYKGKSRTSNGTGGVSRWQEKTKVEEGGVFRAGGEGGEKRHHPGIEVHIRKLAWISVLRKMHWRKFRGMNS